MSASTRIREDHQKYYAVKKIIGVHIDVSLLLILRFNKRNIWLFLFTLSLYLITR